MGSTGGRARRATFVALALLVGCYYAKYDKLVRTHVALLESMAAKLGDVTARDGLPPPDLAEYRYPLERARDFARIAARRFEGRPSLAALGALGSAYEDLLTAALRLHGTPDDAATRAAFAAALAAVQVRGDAVLAALDRD